MEQYNALITPERLQGVQNLIDATLADVTAAGQNVEASYGEKAALKKAITQLEGSIKITEAEAFMQIGADNTVTIDGKTVKLSNGEMRDMYRVYVTRDLRKQKAEKEAELNQIEVKLFQAKDRWEEAKLAADLVVAKSWAQANLLKFLSSRG
jgi:hypothetical protein